MTKPDDEAFPYSVNHTGLTKREYFAIVALQGILSKHGGIIYAAEEAIRHADALIKELNK
jgi:hypothetical protein